MSSDCRVTLKTIGWPNPLAVPLLGMRNPQWMDGDVEVRLTALIDAVPEKSWVPSCEFTHYFHGRKSGMVRFRVGDEETLKYVGNIGYEVDFPFQGHRLAYRSTRLLLPFFASFGLGRAWLAVNPDNSASRRTCELLGARWVETVDLPPDNDRYASGDRKRCRYVLEL